MNLKNYASRKLEKTKIKRQGWRYKKISKYVKNNCSILDIGCASGFLYDLLKNKNIKYSGIDYNKHFVDYNKKRGLDVKQCDVSKEKLPFEDNSFDIVYCSHVIEHINTREQINFMSEISRVLKRGGKAMIFAPTPYHWYFFDDETHIRPCTHGQLTKLGRNFDLKLVEAKYSKLRFFPNSMQKYLRLPPIRFFLWEVYYIGKKQ